MLETEKETTRKKGGKKILAVLVAVAMAVAVFIFFRKNTNGDALPAAVEKTEAHYKRDEPTEKQIYQTDYKQKVQEMLDSGKSVREVSRETGIRKDVVRKIKKADK